MVVRYQCFLGAPTAVYVEYSLRRSVTLAAASNGLLTGFPGFEIVDFPFIQAALSGAYAETDKPQNFPTTTNPVLLTHVASSQRPACYCPADREYRPLFWEGTECAALPVQQACPSGFIGNITRLCPLNSGGSWMPSSSLACVNTRIQQIAEDAEANTLDGSGSSGESVMEDVVNGLKSSFAVGKTDVVNSLIIVQTMNNLTGTTLKTAQKLVQVLDRLLAASQQSVETGTSDFMQTKNQTFRSLIVNSARKIGNLSAGDNISKVSTVNRFIAVQTRRISQNAGAIRFDSNQVPQFLSVESCTDSGGCTSELLAPSSDGGNKSLAANTNVTLVFPQAR